MYEARSFESACISTPSHPRRTGVAASVSTPASTRSFAGRAKARPIPFGKIPHHGENRERIAGRGIRQRDGQSIEVAQDLALERCHERADGIGSARSDHESRSRLFRYRLYSGQLDRYRRSERVGKEGHDGDFFSHLDGASGFEDDGLEVLPCRPNRSERTRRPLRSPGREMSPGTRVRRRSGRGRSQSPPPRG